MQVEREEILRPFIDDDFDRLLSHMNDDVWDAYLSTKKRDHQDHINAEEQARKLREETERIEREEAERIAVENTRLKDEKDAAEAETKAAEAVLRKMAAEADAKLKVLLDGADEKLKAEKKKAFDARVAAAEKAEAINKENRRLKADADAKEHRRIQDLAIAETARLQKIQDDLNKGDAEKMWDLVVDLRAICNKYQFKSEQGVRFFDALRADMRNSIATIIATIERDYHPADTSEPANDQEVGL